MENKLIVSLSPHVHSGDSIQKNMYGVLIALTDTCSYCFFYLFRAGCCNRHCNLCCGMCVL